MRKLLVVDDEVDICDFLKTFFEERDYEVHTANSGDAAVEAVARLKPQIVLLDIQMPGMSGIDALKKIKESNPQVKVIMVTAIETREKIETAMRFGADNTLRNLLVWNILRKMFRKKLNTWPG